MTAMRNASKNAGELIDSLTLDMNRARRSPSQDEPRVGVTLGAVA